MVKVGHVSGTCPRCGRQICRPRPADIGVCDCYLYCPRDHGRGLFGTFMTEVDYEELIYVGDYNPVVTQWTKTGVAPYLNADDASNIRSSVNGAIEKYFTFGAPSDRIPVSTLAVFELLGRSAIEGTQQVVGLYNYEGDGFMGRFNFSSLQYSWEVGLPFSLPKEGISTLKVYVVKESGVNNVYLNALRLRLTPFKLDLTPATYAPIIGGDAWGDIEHPMDVLRVCPICQYHSARKPVEVRLG